MSHTSFLVAAALALISTLGPSRAGAQATLISGLGGAAGYGPAGQCLSPNDDGSSDVIDITPWFPAGLRFFDRTHTQLYVNTNGNITFSGRVSTYTPRAFPVADQPMIAPFWGDVDIRNTGGRCMGSAGVTCTVCEPCHDPSENGVWWYFEEGRAIFTWDRVGYYTCHNDRRMSFQLILTAAEGCGGAGDFDVEFRYNVCDWETGDASGGSGGFGGTPAQAGFDAGNSMDFVEIMGSRMAGIADLLCTTSNVEEVGVWRFQIRSGVVLCPDAGEACPTGLEGVCASGRTACVGDGTECRQEVESSPEICDALDNDCDGIVDEGDDLCREREVCEMGVCIDVCFEGGCPPGQECIGSRCLDAACVDVECPPGEVCIAGECVGACDGVTCPPGLLCRGGRCVDLCVGSTCDEDCAVCDDGACVPRCDLEPCEAGFACLETGHCVEEACAAVTCPAGQVCEAGACVDACAGVSCPRRQMCVMGACVPEAEPDPPDAGPPRPGFDAGPRPPAVDAGADRDDAGPGAIDAGPGSVGPAKDDGCGCRVPGAPRSGATPWAVLALALVAGSTRARRRRR